MGERAEPSGTDAGRFDIPGDGGTLRRRSVRSGAVTFTSQGVSYAIHLGSVAILARLLAPEDYGLVAMVTAVTAFASLFQDLGLSSATVQKDGITEGQLSTMFWINVAMGVVLTLGVTAMAPGVAWFYQKPELVPVTIALSLHFVVGSLAAQQRALLTRQMRFTTGAVIHISAMLINLGVSVAIAMGGGRYWALVWGGLASSAWSTLGLWVVARWRPGWPRQESGIREMIRFGANITAFNLVNYFHRNLDNVLIGKAWGPDALGLYSRAYALLMLPIANLRGPLTRVAFPALSRLKHQPMDYRAYYRRATSLLAFTAMPLTAFLFATSPLMIELVLGARWLEVAEIFRVLSVAAFLMPISGFRGVVFLSLGLGRPYFHLGVLNAVCVTLGFAAGLPWGPIGVACGYVVATWFVQVPAIFYLTRTTPVTAMDLLAPAMRPAFASVLAAALSMVCLGAQWMEGAIPQLLLGCSIFAACYLLIYGMIPGGGGELRSILSLWRHLRPLPKPAGANALIDEA
jgi:polysaccharide transporter, PST family